MTKGLYSLGIVCDVRCAAEIGFCEPITAKDLRRLRLPQSRPGQCGQNPLLFINPFQGIGNWNSRDSGPVTTGSGKHGIDKARRGQRSDGVMNRYKRDIRSDTAQGVIHRVMPLGPAFNKFYTTDR